ncbi:hypothetical protein SAMN05720615_1124 [Stenotrophomonas indicatrix]|nr:hypothetical protein SAMN05720615_1124 [Stenotrophomonas indicatrix]
MENPQRMSDLADEPAELRSLKAIYGSKNTLFDVLTESGCAARVRQLSLDINGRGDVQLNERLMISICRQFDPIILADHFLHECKKHLKSPLYVTPERFFAKSPLNGLVIYKDSAVQVHYMQSLPTKLNLSTRSTADTGISISGSDSLILFARGQDVEYRTFNVESGDADCEARLSTPQIKRACADDHVFLEGGKQGMHLCNGMRPVGMLICISRQPRLSTTQHFAVGSGTLFGHTAANVEESRLHLLASVLAEIPGQRNVQMLLHISTHPTPFIRWHAIRSLHRLDPEAARRRLHEMSRSDSDDEIRMLAAQCTNNG